MKADEKYLRITITLPPDLGRWIKEKEANLNAKDRRMKTSVSAIISDAVEEMKQREESLAPGQAMPDLPSKMGNVAAHPHTGPKVVTPHSQSVGGSSTATKGRSRKTG